MYIKAFYYFLVFVIGASFGSFLNALVWRTRENMKIAGDRSICPHCRHTLRWYENIPILSYFLILNGKCSKCKIKISKQYPIVEFFVGVAFVLLAIHHSCACFFSFTPELFRDWILAFILAFIFNYDFRYKEILDQYTIVPAFLLFGANVSMNWISWQSMTLGMIIAAGFFFIQYVVSKGKWIGGGDIRFGILMGVILGWKVTIFALVLAYVLGAIFSVFFISLKKKSMGSEVAFGTYLSVATFIAMLWGERIVSWYLSLLS